MTHVDSSGPPSWRLPIDRGTCRRPPPTVFARALPQPRHFGEPVLFGAVASVGCFHTAFPGLLALATGVVSTHLLAERLSSQRQLVRVEGRLDRRLRPLQLLESGRGASRAFVVASSPI